LAGALDKWVLSRSAAVVCHGPYLYQHLADNGVEQSKITEFNWSFRHLLQAVDPEGVPDVAEGNRFKVILFVGRVAAAKGVFDLEEACRTMLAQDKGLRLVYAGDGPDLEKLQARAAALGLTDRVIFLGRVRHDRLGPVLRRATLLVTPTRRNFPEGRCMAVIEGLVLGVPVIAPNFGPFPYLVQHRRNGLLYDPDSIPALSQAIRSVLQDDDLRRSLQAGTRRSAVALLNPPITFREAVQSAFEQRPPAASPEIDVASQI
jgi:glycosyltransferase involved in cell wall biosynthesis